MFYLSIFFYQNKLVLLGEVEVVPDPHMVLLPAAHPEERRVLLSRTLP